MHEQFHKASHFYLHNSEAKVSHSRVIKKLLMTPMTSSRSDDLDDVIKE